MIRPDGSSTISILGGESLSAELAHELMGIQVIPRLVLYIRLTRPVYNSVFVN